MIIITIMIRPHQLQLTRPRREIGGRGRNVGSLISNTGGQYDHLSLYDVDDFVMLWSGHAL